MALSSSSSSLLFTKTVLIVVIICIIITTTFSTLVATSSTFSSDLQLIHLSDFHYDPFFGTSCGLASCKHSTTPKSGLPGCDSSAEMVKGVLRQVARTIVNSKATSFIVVYTGDWFRHGMTEKCLGNSTQVGFEIIEFILTSFKQDLYNYIDEYSSATPLKSIQQNNNKKKIHLLPFGHHEPFSRKRTSSSSASVSRTTFTTGNEDYIPDYHFNFSQITISTSPISTSLASLPVHPFFRLTPFKMPTFDIKTKKQPNQILQKFGSSLLSSGYLQTPQQATLFSKCGYSFTEIHDSKIRVIILNTLLYCTELKPETYATDPCGQFSFLTQQLSEARNKGQKVFLQSHIPPLFGLWNPLTKYYETYNQIVSRFNDVISIQLYGHIHRFQYGAMTSLVKKGDFQMMPQMFLGGPLTRASKTTPDFGVYDLDPVNFSVIDVRQVVIANNNSGGGVDPLLESSWQMGPSFKEEMNISSLTTSTLYGLAQAMRSDSAFEGIFQKYFKFEQGGRVPEGVTCTGSCQKIASCELIAFTTLENAGCYL